METKVIALMVAVIAAILVLIVLLIASGRFGKEMKVSVDLINKLLGG